MLRLLHMSYCCSGVAQARGHEIPNLSTCHSKMTPVGFEPTPFRNGALSHRLRPLGQSVVVVIVLIAMCKQPCSAGTDDQETWKSHSCNNVCTLLEASATNPEALRVGYFFRLTLEPFHPPRNPPFLEQARKKSSAPAALEPWAVEWELRVRSIFFTFII